MAKGKPSRAFLEALKQDRKRSGNESSGGFKTPDWFFNNQKRPDTAAPPAPAPTPASVPALTPAPAKKPYQFKPLHAAAAAGVVLILVSISYIAGRAGQEPPKTSPPSEQILGSAPQEGVLELDRPLASIPAPAPKPATPGDDASQAQLAAPAGRVVGLNYVVVQSYKEEQLANEAAAALRAGGLGCTVEHGLPGYSATWYVVVGTEGFPKATTPEYQAYVRKVQAIGDKFAGNSKWKRFEPNPYKWR